MFNYYDIKDKFNPNEILMYLRKSRADDPSLTVEEVLSKHEAMLDEWCERNLNGFIPEENRFKEVVSGESISARPVFQQLLKLAEQPNIRAVLVVEISRLGRPDTAEIGFISKLFRYTNVLIITPERTFNVVDDYERDMFEQELKRGNFYLEYTKKLLGRGREQSVKSGNYVGSRPPYGYDKTMVMDGRKKCPTLSINEEQANIVRMIFNWFVHDNVGTQYIANKLNDMHINPPRNNVWTPDAIRTILENVHYIGKVKWNARKSIYIVEDGNFRKTRPKTSNDEVIISEGKHPPIISEELFNAAQEKRGQTHKTHYNKELRNPLASILYCECGRAMSYRHSTRGNLKYRDPRLVCNGQKYCKNGSCSVEEITDIVIKTLRERIADFEREIQGNGDNTHSFHEKHLKQLEKKLANRKAKEREMWNTQLDPDITKRMPDHVFQDIKNSLMKEIEEITLAIEKTRSVISTPVDNEKKLISFKKALEALTDDKVSVREKNNFLKACIDRIEYHREAPTKVTGKGAGRQWNAEPIALDIKLKV